MNMEKFHSTRIARRCALFLACAMAIGLAACTRSYEYSHRAAREGEVYREDIEVSEGSRLQTRIGTRIVLPEGISPIQLNSGSVESIRDVLKAATISAFTPGRLNNLKNQLVEADRARIERTEAFRTGRTETEQRMLNAFRELWYSKYGQEFGMYPEDQILDSTALVITEGRVTAPRVIANWPLRPVRGAEITRTEPSEMPVRMREINLQEGRRVAVAIMPTDGYYPETTISMIREFPVLWKIDIPADVSASEIIESLDIVAREMISEPTENWPDRIDDAYRMLTRRVVLALYGVHADGRGRNFNF